MQLFFSTTDLTVDRTFIHPMSLQSSKGQSPFRIDSERRVLLLLPGLVLGILLSGCNPPPRPVLGKNAADSLPTVLIDDEAAPQPGTDLIPAAFTQPWETWQAYYIGGRHVGYSHVKAAPQSQQPDSLVVVTLADQLTLRRGPSTIVQRLDQTSIESRGGELVSFEAKLTVGPAVTQYSGSVDDETLTVVITRGSQQSTQRVPWQASIRGPVGLQQSLQAVPIARGQQRRLQTLIPIRFDVATIELDCRYQASIAMPDGTVRKALEVDVSTQLKDAAPIETLLWTADDGKVIKTYTPALDLVAFDSTAEAAMQGIVASDDILTSTAIQVAGTLEKPDQAAVVTYRITPRQAVKNRNDSPVFQPQPGQWVRTSEAGHYDLLVSRNPTASQHDGFLASTLAPVQEDGRSNPLINSTDSLVKQLADTAIAKKNDRLRLALELTKSAHSLIRKKGYTQGFVPASQVARDGAGDCTAHAVLLAAMLRARGIPARVAVGLVYVPAADHPRMAYHMWTLAHIDDAWVHFDATLPGGFAPANRITLTTHTLAGGNEYESLTPVIGAIGQFNIEIVDSALGPIDPTAYRTDDQAAVE